MLHLCDTPDVSEITLIVAGYAKGSTNFDVARERMRRIEPAPYESTSPYSNEATGHEGGFTELQGACMAHDLTFGEHEVLRCELAGTDVDLTVLDQPSSQRRMGIHPRGSE